MSATTVTTTGAAPIAVPEPDLDESERFLAILDPESSSFTYQVFDDTPEQNPAKARIYHGSLENEAKRLTSSQRKICGVFITVNETDGCGRKAKNITRVRAVFADLDGSPLHPVMSFGLEPHIVVESSPGRYHVYWLVDGLALDEFGPIQSGIAARFKGDPSITDLCRVLRLPGFWHLKGEPFMSRIVHTAERLPYTADEIRAAFPPAPAGKARANGGATAAPGDIDEMDGLVQQITTGESYHGPLCALAWRYLNAGMAGGQVVQTLRGMMLAVPADARDQRWQSRLDEIPRTVSTAEAKLGAEARTEAPGAEPEQDAPPVADTWPAPLDEAAFYGLAGTIVRAIEPHTEADAAALLVQLLVAAGNAIGRGPHVPVEGDRHTTNLFALMIGVSSKARKGTSWGRIAALMEKADPEWTANRVVGGLSSGEGLIWEARDPIEKQERVREKGQEPRYETVITDHGVADKRTMVLESEFASTLRVMTRDGSNLSAVVRQAWDKGDLRTMTKNSPARATGAMISIIGHITADELRRYLDRTELANGFINRFLLVCTRRSKLLPEGGQLDAGAVDRLGRELRAAILHARNVGAVGRDDEARDVWRTVYAELSEARPGLLGAALSRAEAQVTRLSLIYALLNRKTVVEKEHLLAALAVWEYCEASARHVFGDSVGDPVGDEILRALRASPDGLTRNDLVNLFSRHRDGAQIARALGELLQLGLAAMSKESTGGRPAERWRAAR